MSYNDNIAVTQDVSESSTYGGRVSSIKTSSTPNMSVTKQYDHTQEQVQHLYVYVHMYV